MASNVRRQRTSCARDGPSGASEMTTVAPSHDSNLQKRASEEVSIEQERELLLNEKREEMKRVLDSHDDLIRETFHLEKFVSLLYYDPKEAKKDESAVFREYKGKHDLVMKNSTAGPSRTTRRAQNEWLSALKAQPQAEVVSHAMPSESISVPMASSSKLNGSASVYTSHSISAVIPNTSGRGARKHAKGQHDAKETMGDVVTRAKGKQKGSISDEEDDEINNERGRTILPSASRALKMKGKQKAMDEKSTVSRVSRSRSTVSECSTRHSNRLLATTTSYKGSSRRLKGHSKDHRRHPEPSLDEQSTSSNISVKKSRLKQHNTKIPYGSTYVPSHSYISRDHPSFHITIPASRKNVKAETDNHRPTVSGKTLPTFTSPKRSADDDPMSLASRPTIKRIKLIVREPPPSFSSPRQRPPPPAFGKDISAFLSSYINIDGKDYTEEALESAARQQVRLLKRIGSLKSQGRLLLDADTALALKATGEAGSKNLSALTTDALHRPNDVWATIIAEVIAVRNTMSRHRFGRGGVIASSIVSKLDTRWANLRAREGREAQAEEKRLRVLARMTLRLVQNEWKKVVFSIREEQRLHREAEEKRLGRQHLDAILDQSGQILEKQQQGLSKTDVMREMSRSVTESFDDGGSETDVLEYDSEGGTELVGSENAEDDQERSVAGDEGSFIESEAATEDIDSVKFLYDIEKDSDAEVSESLSVHPDNDNDEEISTLPDDRSQGPESISVAESNQSEADENENQDDDNEYDVDHIEPHRYRSVTSQLDDHDIDGREEYGLFDADEAGSSAIATPLTDEVHPHNGDILKPDIVTIKTASVDNIQQDPESITAQHVHYQLAKTKTGIQSTSPLAKVTDLMKSTTNGHTSPVSIELGAPSPDHVISLLSSELLSEQQEGQSSPAATTTPDVQTSGIHCVKDHSEAQVAVAGEEGKSKSVERTFGESKSPREGDSEDESVSETSTRNGTGELVSAVLTRRWEPPKYLQPFAVAHVVWDPETKLTPPLLLRGSLRPYQQSGLEWLATLHNNNMNGILADEMGLGKTIQTIALLAHLACDRGIWGPHLIIVPTSVLLNWDMEFKKFLPGFKILNYHGSTKRRKELRQGWTNKHNFNVCITSYTLASRDAHIFKRKAWYYMVLDEAHMIKNFKSQRWNILLMFRSFRRLLLTGTPLQNNLTELWALLQFLMSGTKFANLKEFGDWFSNPLEKAIELGNVQDEEVQSRVMKLHTVLRPYLLRRLKRDVEKELPSKYEHLVLCRLSKRQRFLYDEFMSRAQTREDLKSGIYQKIANILMQLRKVCNHPDLFEVRPIVTSFAMEKSAIADFEIKELLVRRRLLKEDEFSQPDFDLLGLRFSHLSNTSLIAAQGRRSLEEMLTSELIAAYPGQPPPRDMRTVEGYRQYRSYQQRAALYERWSHMAHLNRHRCQQSPIYPLETVNIVRKLYRPLIIDCDETPDWQSISMSRFIKSYDVRSEELAEYVNRFAFATPAAVAVDLPAIALREAPKQLLTNYSNAEFDAVLHRAAVRLQVVFPDVSLLQYDCGKLQELARLLRERKAGGHRVLIFTQMTRILDILEMFLNFHGYLYLRLDGATKIEDRQYITERFNVDARVFAFIASSRSGGVGINLTGADTVIFYDSDFNPQMDRQCEDRAHRIGQIRDVHIYRFISQYTVEEAMLRKANQKRSLDDIVIQQGEFDWRSLFGSDEEGGTTVAIQKALVEFEDFEDAHAAKVAASEEAALEGEDKADFADLAAPIVDQQPVETSGGDIEPIRYASADVERAPSVVDNDDEGGTTVDYMLSFVKSDMDFFRDWKL